MDTHSQLSSFFSLLNVSFNRIIIIEPFNRITKLWVEPICSDIFQVTGIVMALDVITVFLRRPQSGGDQVACLFWRCSHGRQTVYWWSIRIEARERVLVTKNNAIRSRRIVRVNSGLFSNSLPVLDIFREPCIKTYKQASFWMVWPFRGKKKKWSLTRGTTWKHANHWRVYDARGVAQFLRRRVQRIGDHMIILTQDLRAFKVNFFLTIWQSQFHMFSFNH